MTNATRSRTLLRLRHLHDHGPFAFARSVEPLQLFAAGAVERLRIGREAAVADVAEELLEGALHVGADLRVLAHELRRVAVVHAEDVVVDEDLAVAERAGADADRRNGQPLADERAELRRNAFEDEREAAGMLERESFVDQSPRVVRVLALQLEA